MEKEPCADSQKFPRKMTLRQRIAAATGLVAKSSRGQFGSRDLCYAHHPFSSPTTVFFLCGDSVITRTADLALCSFSYDI